MRAGGQQADVEVGERHAEQREPGEQQVAGVQPRDEGPQRGSGPGAWRSA